MINIFHLSTEMKLLVGLFILITLCLVFLICKSSCHPFLSFRKLERAIANGQIVPFYQPIVDAQEGKLAGVEVLARWKSTKGRFLPPDFFIPLAEKTGLIVPLTNQMMKSVAIDLAEFSRHMGGSFHISLNISASHINDDELLKNCQNLIDNLNQVRLILEITERERFVVTPEVLKKISKLRDIGVRIALDDFGTGYSNLDYLSEIHVDIIKIDKSFINCISEGNDSFVLLDCIIEMATSLKLDVIAEGVESSLQKDYLAAKNIRYAQGYYFSPPLSSVDFIQKYMHPH